MNYYKRTPWVRIRIPNDVSGPVLILSFGCVVSYWHRTIAIFPNLVDIHGVIFRYVVIW
jgi:hypothetical protein